MNTLYTAAPVLIDWNQKCKFIKQTAWQTYQQVVKLSPLLFVIYF